MVHADRAHGVTFSRNGNFVATVSYDNTVLVWEVPAGRVAARFVQDASVYNASFSYDGQYLAIGAHASMARVWKWRENREVARIVNDDGLVSRVESSPDGRRLASGGIENDHTARLWELPYATKVPREWLEREACTRLTRNLSRAEWSGILSSEGYQKTCPNLPELGE